MTDLRSHRLWPEAQMQRKRQRLLGLISGIAFAIALIALMDGLQALMRTGTNELEFIPGQSMALSGPAALKNPLASDVQTRFSPGSAPFLFSLEGFFTGYWFGSGMWRGELRCGDDAPEGQYQFTLSFRGAGAQNAQKYDLHVFTDSLARQRASRSLLRRSCGLNPFVIAAFCGMLGLLGGAGTFLFGWRLAHSLRRLGLAEIYARQGDHFLCLSPKAMAPGTPCAVLDENGEVCGEALADGWVKGKLRFIWQADRALPAHALVRLRRPEQD